MARTAAVSSGVGSSRYPAMKRAARNMRSGSSPKLTSGAIGVRSVRVARSTAPSNGSMSAGSPVSTVSSRAIAFTVKSRRERSLSISSANTTCGLRESSVYASARNVVIS